MGSAVDFGSVLFLIFMTGRLSGVMRVPYRCPGQCQEWCRNWPILSLRLSVSQGASLGDILLAPACPIKKGSQWEGLIYLTSDWKDAPTVRMISLHNF